MLWTAIIILQALSVLSEQTRAEYLSPVVERLSRGNRYAESKRLSPERMFFEEPSSSGAQSYLYMTKDDSGLPPTDCVKCILPYLKGSSLSDPCECLPCASRVTERTIGVLKNLFIYFRTKSCRGNFTYSNLYDDNNNRYVKFVEEYLTDEDDQESIEREQEESSEKVKLYDPQNYSDLEKTKNYKIEIKMEGDDSLVPTLQPQVGIVFRRLNNGSKLDIDRELGLPKDFRRSEVHARRQDKARHSRDPLARLKSQRNCVGEECRREDKRSGEDESHRENRKLTVRRVFKDILSRMDRINLKSDRERDAGRVEKPAGRMEKLTRRNESPKNGEFDDGNNRAGLGMYEMPYQRPTYHVKLPKQKSQTKMESLAEEEKEALLQRLSGLQSRSLIGVVSDEEDQKRLIRRSNSSVVKTSTTQHPTSAVTTTEATTEGGYDSDEVNEYLDGEVNYMEMPMNVQDTPTGDIRWSAYDDADSEKVLSSSTTSQGQKETKNTPDDPSTSPFTSKPTKAPIIVKRDEDDQGPVNATQATGNPAETTSSSVGTSETSTSDQPTTTTVSTTETTETSTSDVTPNAVSTYGNRFSVVLPKKRSGEVTSTPKASTVRYEHHVKTDRSFLEQQLESVFLLPESPDELTKDSESHEKEPAIALRAWKPDDLVKQKPSNQSVDADDNKTQGGDGDRKQRAKKQQNQDASGSDEEEPILKIKVNVYTDFDQGNVYGFLSRLLPQLKIVDAEAAQPKPRKPGKSQGRTRRTAASSLPAE